MDRFDQARELYWSYDGSSFSMWHDGVLETFQAFGVPDEVCRAWDEEMLREKLSKLDGPRNFTVVSFLNHHRYDGYLLDLIAVRPQGTHGERCAYLECVLQYADRCAAGSDHESGGDYAPAVLRQALEWVIEQADLIFLTESRTLGPGRATGVREAAHRRLAVCLDEDGSWLGPWDWHPPTRTATLHRPAAAE